MLKLQPVERGPWLGRRAGGAAAHGDVCWNSALLKVGPVLGALLEQLGELQPVRRTPGGRQGAARPDWTDCSPASLHCLQGGNSRTKAEAE